MKRIIVPGGNVALDGMPWFEHNGRRLWRLPHELEGRIPRELWETSLGGTGARLRFRSDTASMKLRVNYGELWPARNMTRIVKMGFDLYADGRYWNSAMPDEKGETTFALFDRAERRMREFTLYFPLFYSELDVLGLYVDDGAEILPPTAYALAKPVVFYGTSITHGGCASRPGLAYQAILCRELNLDFVNLGFSGCGRVERCVAEAIAAIDAACYVLDYGQNNHSVEEMRLAYLPFIETIRSVRPAVPILMSTPVFRSSEHWDAGERAYLDAKREIVRGVYRRLSDQGDANIHLIEGSDLLPPGNGEVFVDGVHPNDLGFASMSRAFGEALKQILHL